MTSGTVEHGSAHLVDALGRAGYRLTEPRRTVAELVAGREGHFTAAEPVDDTRRRHVDVGRATVFRALDVFTTLGLVERVDLPDGEHAYVACDAVHHHHAICTRCGRSLDVDDAGLAEVLADIGRRSGFEVTAPAEIFGLCEACRRERDRADDPSRPDPRRPPGGRDGHRGLWRRRRLAAHGRRRRAGRRHDHGPRGPGREGRRRALVESLVPKGGEVHTFAPAPSDLRRRPSADLIVGNGLGLDDWVIDLAADAGAGAPIVKLGEALPGWRTWTARRPTTGSIPTSGSTSIRARSTLTRIAEVLSARPADAAGVRDRAAAYDSGSRPSTPSRRALRALPGGGPARSSLPRRFPYFAAAYGLDVDGAVVGARARTPQRRGRGLIDAIRASGARRSSPRRSSMTGSPGPSPTETGATVVSNLLTDSVGDAPQDTYVGAMRWNVEQVAAALAGS